MWVQRDWRNEKERKPQGWGKDFQPRCLFYWSPELTLSGVRRQLHVITTPTTTTTTTITTAVTANKTPSVRAYQSIKLSALSKIAMADEKWLTEALCFNSTPSAIVIACPPARSVQIISIVAAEYPDTSYQHSTARHCTMVRRTQLTTCHNYIQDREDTCVRNAGIISQHGQGKLIWRDQILAGQSEMNKVSTLELFRLI